MDSQYKYLPEGLVSFLQGMHFTVKKTADNVRQGTYRASSYGTSVEFAEYREYTPGDPTNLIDWAVYARSDRYMIRKSHKEVSIKAYVMLDISESLNFRKAGFCTKFEYGCYIASSILYLLIRRQNSASLITFDSKIRFCSEQTTSFEPVLPLIAGLETIKPKNKSDIENVLHEAAEFIPAHSFVIIISDFLQSPEKIIRGLHHLNFNHHEILALHIIDRAEISPEFNGLTELVELETGKRILIDPYQIKDSYKEAVDKYFEILKNGCAEADVAYHLLETSRPVEESITAFLKEKG